MSYINDDTIRRSLLYMTYDSKKTLNENYKESLLLENVVSYSGPFYPKPLASGGVGDFGDYNYKDGKRFKTGVAGSKFSVAKTTIDSGGNVVTVIANDLGIKFQYSCKSNTDKSYSFKFNRGDIYDKDKWNKNCCVKAEDWNVDYWNDEDGTNNWAIPGLGPLLYQDYCVEKKDEVKKDPVKTKDWKDGGGVRNDPGKDRKPTTGWNENCKPNYKIGCKSITIGKAQQCLKDDGLYPYRVDDKFGRRTEEAVYKKLKKYNFTDSDLQTICKTTQGGGGDDMDFDKDNRGGSEEREKEDTTWTGEVY